MKERKKEVTLMTLLANEAISDSRKLLKEYKVEDAKSCDDLEHKLANLYFGQSDKVEIEQKLANIHPHKKWLIKSLDLVKKSEIKPKQDMGSEKIDSQLKSDAVLPSAKFSDFLGSKEDSSKSTPTSEVKNNYLLETVTMLGVFSIIGLTFIVVSKNLSK